MMEPVKRIDDTDANPIKGVMQYDWPKLIWNFSMILPALILIPFTFNYKVLILFLTLTYLSLLIGHSVGMHRMMIHRTFECPKVVERLLIYIGVLVGMSGPYGIIKIHDTRDWAQRQPECHDYFSHKRSYWQDLWWQLTCKFVFDNPPKLIIEPKLSDDKFYQFLEKSWRFHQLGLALVLFLIGSWPYVIWGVFLRVSVSVIGHWTITYFCHNPGPGVWRVKDAAVQASNIPGLGILTYGECWHNNHHAFPESARIGLGKGQCDPAWRFIQLLKLLRLANNIGSPRSSEEREDLYRIS